MLLPAGHRRYGVVSELRRLGSWGSPGLHGRCSRAARLRVFLDTRSLAEAIKANELMFEDECPTRSLACCVGEPLDDRKVAPVWDRPTHPLVVE